MNISRESGQNGYDSGVTPSVLHPKSFTKTCHEHHVYVLVYVIKCVDQFLVT